MIFFHVRFLTQVYALMDFQLLLVHTVFQFINKGLFCSQVHDATLPVAEPSEADQGFRAQVQYRPAHGPLSLRLPPIRGAPEPSLGGADPAAPLCATARAAAGQDSAPS